MNDSPIMRPEFDLYVKMTAEAMKKIAASSEEQAIESRETNTILREYIITNNNKHERTSEEIDVLKMKYRKIKDAVEANSKVTSIANKIKIVAWVIAVGGLTAFGAYLFDRYWPKVPTYQEVPKHSEIKHE